MNSSNLEALILAESAAWSAFNASNAARIEAMQAYDASWKQTWGGTEDAYRNLVNARSAHEAASKALYAARVARFALAAALDPACAP
jgi:hypothetical protein